MREAIGAFRGEFVQALGLGDTVADGEYVSLGKCDPRPLPDDIVGEGCYGLVQRRLCLARQQADTAGVLYEPAKQGRVARFCGMTHRREYVAAPFQRLCGPVVDGLESFGRLPVAPRRAVTAQQRVQRRGAGAGTGKWMKKTVEFRHGLQAVA